MLRRPIVGVVGGGVADAATEELAEEVGRLVAASGCFLLCGGRGGVMAAAARGAGGAKARTIGILPFAHEREGVGNGYIQCEIFTGLGDARNYVNARASDALIALAGEAGTLSEIALALKVGTPVVYLRSWRFLYDQPALAAFANLVEYAETAPDAVRGALRLIGFEPGEPFDRPYRYPLLPDQTAQSRELLRFLQESLRAERPT
jgi:uncharacterized protein (TIGR00725 family)